MRQAQIRTLNAMGYVLGSKSKAQGLNAHEGTSPQGEKVILVQAKLTGPSWPSIAWFLESNGVEFKILEAGGIWLVIDLDSRGSEVLRQVKTAAKTSGQDEVFLPQVGFARSVVKKRFEFRLLIAPLAIFAATLLIAFLRPNPTIEPTEQIENLTEISCALDLSSRDFDNWLSKEIFKAVSTADDALVIQTSLGLLNLKVDSSLGSTLRISGYLECQDGRTKELRFRADSSATGGLIQLGEKLDP